MILNGTTDPRFTAVRDAFAAGFDSGREAGAGLCVYLHGEPVVELWGGVADQDAGRPWQRDTLVPLASVTKTLLATMVLMAAQHGELKLDLPVAHLWPEFGSAGKDEITLEHALAHRAGIPAFDRAVTFQDQLERTPILEQLAGLRPIWRPGTAHGYHAITLGFLLTEVLRRAVGTSEQPLFKQLVSGPLKADMHIGLPEADLARLAVTIPPSDEYGRDDPRFAEFSVQVADPASLFYRSTFGSSAMTFEDMNDPRYIMLERPAGGFATAGAVARFFAALIGEVGGVRLLAPEWTERARAVHSGGVDQVWRLETTWGLGFLLPGGPLWLDLGPQAFGHIGSTGALAFADPEYDLAFAYLPNRMRSVYELPDRRAHRLVKAAYAAVGARPAAALSSGL